MVVILPPDPKWTEVKFWYKSLVGLILIFSLALSAIPIYFIVGFLAEFFNIDGERAIEGQENATIFVSLSVIVVIVSIVSSHLLSFYLVGRHNDWSFKQSIHIFMGNNYPAHWYKK